MKFEMRFLFVSISSVVVLNACSSQPVVPDAKNVKVTRDNPAKDCELIGHVQGSVATNTGTIDRAIEDMRLDAARRGANFIHMEATGALGTSVAGTAYQCP